MALEGIPEVRPGDDIAALIAAAPPPPGGGIGPGDVVVIAHKIVSKAEGRVRALADVTPGASGAKPRAASTARTPATCRLCSTSPSSCCARPVAC